MKIYILLAHPDSDTFNGQIADAYAKTAQEKGHEVGQAKLLQPVMPLGSGLGGSTESVI